MGQPRRPPPDDRPGPVGRAPRLGHLATAAAAARRHRVRQGPRHPLRLPAHLRPAARRRRRPHRRARRAHGPSQPQRHPRYYRVGEERRRDAVDKVTAMQFDRHGNRIWRDARALLDDEHARYAVGSVAVPYGTCTEPSNVAAGGTDCPLRFRCAGCDHFRTDVSYLPDLSAYLDDLLRTRERLAAASGDDWALAAAAPSEEEIPGYAGSSAASRATSPAWNQTTGPASTRPSPSFAGTAPSASACPASATPPRPRKAPGHDRHHPDAENAGRAAGRLRPPPPARHSRDQPGRHRRHRDQRLRHRPRRSRRPHLPLPPPRPARAGPRARGRPAIRGRAPGPSSPARPSRRTCSPPTNAPSG